MSRTTGFCIILVLFLVPMRISHAAGPLFLHYKISGYKNKTSGPHSKVTIDAQEASGLDHLGFEELRDATVVISLENEELVLNGKNVLVKPDRFLLTQSASAELRNVKTKKEVFHVLALKPDSLLYVDLTKNIIKCPKSEFEFHGKSVNRRSIMINLMERKVQWLQYDKDRTLPLTIPF